ncbi:MAG: DegT/DnrJ/EryC1/StrS family aminotransferase [bacterium]
MTTTNNRLPITKRQSKWRVPLLEANLGKEEIKALERVIESKWLSMGEATEEFEHSFASYLGVKYALAVSSGTAALHLAYLAMGIGPGDEVIVPSLTFVATANAVLYTGAEPIFADISGDNDLNISPADIEAKITERTKGIAVVHYGGYPARMDEIGGLAEAHHLLVVEDVAHAPGAEFEGRKLGTIGNIGCFSFYANKNLVVGEGGMVVTNDEGLANKVRILRSHGMTALAWQRYRVGKPGYDCLDLGYNYRMDELSAALGLVQLNKLEEDNLRRGKLVAEYRKRLAVFSHISLPFDSHYGKSAYHIMPLLLNGLDRDNFIQELGQKRIQTSIHYSPIHLFTYYRQRFGYQEGLLPRTESVSAREVTLPLYSTMSEDDLAYVVDSIQESVRS